MWKLGAIFIESSKYRATLQSLAHEHASAKQAFLHHAAVVWPALAHRSCSPYREKHCLLTYFLEWLHPAACDCAAQASALTLLRESTLWIVGLLALVLSRGRYPTWLTAFHNAP